jgi:hypothetical protein
MYGSRATRQKGLTVSQAASPLSVLRFLFLSDVVYLDSAAIIARPLQKRLNRRGAVFRSQSHTPVRHAGAPRMDHHALRRCSHGLRQSLPENIVALLADANAVDRTQDDRRAGIQHNHAATAQAESTLRLDRVIGHHAAHGWGGAHIEHGQPQTFGPQRPGDGDKGAGDKQRNTWAA